MKDKTKLVNWATDCLAYRGCQLMQDPEIVIETPWSTVIRFSTSKGCFYLKKTPVDLFIEPEVIKAIQENMSSSLTPVIVSKNSELHCFLMKSCGDYSLRTKFKGKINTDLLVNGLENYIKILRSFEKNHKPLETIGVPNWGMNYLPDLYAEFLQKKDMLYEEGLTKDELDRLLKLVPRIKSICKYISEQKILETLVNADFNENNLIIDESTQKISIIDLGETVIAHPFFSIAAHLQSLSRRYKLELKSPILENIKQKCISSWLDVASQNELDTTYQNILRLLPIFSSLAIERLQVATDNKSKEMQNWFISGVLRMLLENLEDRV